VLSVKARGAASGPGARSFSLVSHRFVFTFLSFSRTIADSFCELRKERTKRRAFCSPYMRLVYLRIVYYVSFSRQCGEDVYVTVARTSTPEWRGRFIPFQRPVAAAYFLGHVCGASQSFPRALRSVAPLREIV